ncbi:uncharacterized protein TNCV_4251381 [Trichonephila clavipes]|nr:uncharacterized protein TNCV_4251381 [Trichonephila clavipes]
MGVVELNIRIRDFEKLWLFHVLAELEYPCIPGIHFIGGSKIILNFDRKYLAIPDSQINKPGLTHVLYHEIDTGDNLPVVYRKYRYYWVKQEAIKTDETKVQAIVEMKPPRNSREVSKFLGMFQWDASSIGVGAVLNQEQRPVVFASRTLSAAERNYTVTERECLAVAWALNKFGTYLGYLPIKVITDHAALTDLTTDQVRIYRRRKCDETEIGTGSSDNGSLRDESSGFDRVQRISNESRDGGPERKVQKGSEHRVNKRNLSSNDSNIMLPKFRKKSRREETVTPTTSGYNLRPRIGKRKESRLTIERKTQQGGPVRSRKDRERYDSPYIEERTRSRNKNARRGGDEQRQDQERRGTCTKKSLSLEVLIGNTNYNS